jgi:hypothetical protein
LIGRPGGCSELTIHRGSSDYCFSGTASAAGGASGRRGIITIPPQQQLAGSSCSSKEIAQFHNAAERPDVVALEIAEGSAPHRALSRMVAGLFPQPDQKRVRGGTVGIIAGAATGLVAWLR